MKAFYDTDSIAFNSVNGIYFVPAGLVLEYHPGGGDKAFLVQFIDPMGDVQTEWRHTSEIIDYEIDESTYETVKHRMEQLQK